MKSSHELLLTALLATFAIFHLVQAQDQEGNPHFYVTVCRFIISRFFLLSYYKRNGINLIGVVKLEMYLG